jgi:glycosyltransferase involved in cell wall biosynthesis
MLSFVIPLQNEEESLELLYQELRKAIAGINKSYEIIFVDDGSTDKSLEVLKKLAVLDDRVRIFSFRVNSGKSEALSTGFLKAKGDYIITLDADLQDRPSEIHKLLEKSSGGFEVVSGWRKRRKDKSKMKIISRVFNYIVGQAFGLRLHDYNCGLKLYTKEAAKSLRLYGGLHRFIPLLLHEEGFKVTEVAVEHAPRKYGKSKYGFSKLWKDLPDMLTMLFLVKYGKRPLHFFGIVGGALTLAGLLILGYLSLLRLFGETIGDRPLLIFGILFVLAGFQMFFTGFLADLIIHISQKPPPVEPNFSYKIKYSNEN